MRYVPAGSPALSCENVSFVPTSKHPTATPRTSTTPPIMADPASEDVSRSSTPNPRFTSQNQSAEDVLKEQTVGLVHLSDFRKRRAEAIEQAERTPGAASGSSTPNGRDTPAKPVFKKRKKPVKTGGLSFGDDEEDAGTGVDSTATPIARSRSETPSRGGSALATDSEDSTAAVAVVAEKRLKPNASIAFQHKVMTKASLLREARLKEQLKKEYTQLQEAVKQTDFALPFVFYDGSNAPGGVCRMKKGDPIWLFLERARKLGAGLAGKGDKSKKDWARISVDDLLLVRGELIIPHHYEFHYFILNNSQGYTGTLFPYAASATAATPSHLLPKDPSGPVIPLSDEVPPTTLSTAAQRKQQAANAIPESKLEGYEVDPDLTKVVDRRWYERNKHIYPASMWEEFDPTRDYSQGTRKDALGNAFFFSR
nr:protein fam50 like [Quercus suber]